MSFLTYGQIINGQMCRCNALCMANCVCGCPACLGKGFTLQYEDNKKPKKPSIFTEVLASSELPWVKVNNSSNINAYAYHENNLHVQFIGGGIGKYLNVSEEDFNLLNHAESKGRFISNVLKTKYKYEKVVV